MPFRSFRRSAASVHARVALCMLLLLAVGCRALVPPGFMPDGDRLQRALIGITLCLSSPGSSPLAGLLAAETHREDGGGASAACAYCLAAHDVAHPPPAMPKALPAAWSSPAPVMPASWRALPPLPAIGPPLGPRAPPILLI